MPLAVRWLVCVAGAALLVLRTTGGEGMAAGWVGLAAVAWVVHTDRYRTAPLPTYPPPERLADELFAALMVRPDFTRVWTATPELRRDIMRAAEHLADVMAPAVPETETLAAREAAVDRVLDSVARGEPRCGRPCGRADRELGVRHTFGCRARQVLARGALR